MRRRRLEWILVSVLIAVWIPSPAPAQPRGGCKPLDRRGKLAAVYAQGRLEVTPRVLGWTPTTVERTKIMEDVADSVARVNGCEKRLRFLDWKPSDSAGGDRGSRLVAVISGERGRFYNPIWLSFQIDGNRDPFVDFNRTVYSEFEPRKRRDFRSQVQKAAKRIDEQFAGALVDYARQYIPLIRSNDLSLQSPSPGGSEWGYLEIPELLENTLLAGRGSSLRITWEVQPSLNLAVVIVATLQEPGRKGAVQGEILNFIFRGEGIKEAGRSRLLAAHSRRRPGTVQVYAEDYRWRFSSDPSVATPRVPPNGG